MASILLHPSPLEPFSRSASAASELSGAAVQRCSGPPNTAAPSRLGSTTTPGFPLEPAEGSLRPQRSNSLGVFQFERRLQSAPVHHQQQEGSSSVPSGQQQQQLVGGGAAHQLLLAGKRQEARASVGSGTETVGSYSTEDGLEVAPRPALDVVPPTDSTGFRYGEHERNQLPCTYLAYARLTHSTSLPTQVPGREAQDQVAVPGERMGANGGANGALMRLHAREEGLLQGSASQHTSTLLEQQQPLCRACVRWRCALQQPLSSWAGRAALSTLTPIHPRHQGVWAAQRRGPPV